MSLGKQLRIALLAIASANVLLVFSRSILDPSIGKRPIAPFTFPTAVPLPQWQQSAAQPLPKLTVERWPYGKLNLPGIHYRYQQNNLPLDIKMRYEVETDGNVRQITENNSEVRFLQLKSQPVIRQHQQLGFYGLFVYEQRAYLDACINSRGGSTFTSAQFDTNRIRYDSQLNRLIPWLLGQQNLRDNRCLWAQLSIPLYKSSPQSAYKVLETAWFSWYQWWQPRFPNS